MSDALAPSLIHELVRPPSGGAERLTKEVLREPAGLEDDPRPLDWNGPIDRPFAQFRDEDLDRPIINHLESAARRYPDRIALTDSETSLSYAQLWDGLSGLAETIGAQTTSGDLIGIRLPATPMFPLAMLACLAAGRPFVALDASYPSDWLGQVLETARPSLIIGDEHAPTDADLSTARFILLTQAPAAASQGWRPTELGLDAPACVLFTSGSTGRPKGVVNSQRNLMQRVGQSINAAHINSDDRFLTLASLCTIVGVRDVMTALVAGASVRLVDPQQVGAREILKIIRTEAITILFAFPALLRSVVASDEARAGGALRLMRVGGDTTLWRDIDLLRAWLAPGAAIQLIYAATEAPMMQWFVDDNARQGDARIPIGYPLPGNRLAIVDDLGRPAPPGEAGELIVESRFVALGHWVDGRCIAGAFECEGAPGRRRFPTGDLVRQRPDGLLERLGRKDRQVKIRGARVELDGVEAALRQHPFVADVGALARAGGEGEATLIAYVTARDGAPADLLGELKALMRQAPAPMRPGRLYLADRIPRLPSSKLDVRALLALDEANVQTEQVDAAMEREDGTDGDCIARSVAQVWRVVLHAPEPAPDDDFFDVGGDSLKAISLMIELERSLGVELPLTLIHEAPTFAGLCEAIREQRSAEYVPLVELKGGDGSPPVFFVHGVGGTVLNLFPIARAMTWPGAVIGVQARGLTGKQAPHPTVEAMADAYLCAIKGRQPEGPYHLCGYSFGGLVAFEMARRLSQAGEDVGLVGLFDTTTSLVSWPVRLWLAFVGRRSVQFAASVGDWLRGRPARWRGARPLTSAPGDVLKVAANGLLASARYRPGYFPGELTLFKPAERDPALPSLQAIWRGHAAALSVVDTAGGHLTMFAKPNAERAAAALTRALLKPRRGGRAWPSPSGAGR